MGSFNLVLGVVYLGFLGAVLLLDKVDRHVKKKKKR